jgi:hypothetical protein
MRQRIRGEMVDVYITGGSAGVVTLKWFALFSSRNVGDPVGFDWYKSIIGTPLFRMKAFPRCSNGDLHRRFE